jgi:hypothetical protein
LFYVVLAADALLLSRHIEERLSVLEKQKQAAAIGGLRKSSINQISME